MEMVLFSTSLCISVINMLSMKGNVPVFSCLRQFLYKISPLKWRKIKINSSPLFSLFLFLFLAFPLCSYVSSLCFLVPGWAIIFWDVPWASFLYISILMTLLSVFLSKALLNLYFNNFFYKEDILVMWMYDCILTCMNKKLWVQL